MQLIHPSTSSERFARNRLLEASLREIELPFPIADEYPVVLGNSGDSFSYCLQDGDEIVAHANLWPRRLVSAVGEESITVGLVGNVATAASRRGEGLMTAVLAELKREAGSRGLQALLLWSDLKEYYQTRGFESLGRERRFHMTVNPTGARGAKAGTTWRLANLAEAESYVGEMLALRPTVAWTLERSPAEFTRLMAIPALSPWILTARDGKLEAFALLGRGADLAGVIHEWGTTAPVHLTNGIQQILRTYGWSDALLLAPSHLPRPLADHFESVATAVTDHDLCLGWIAAPSPERVRRALASAFIWGMDSI